MMVERYKAKTNATDVPPHCSMGFNQTWILLNNVLPIAKEKYGGFDAEAVRVAMPASERWVHRRAYANRGDTRRGLRSEALQAQVSQMPRRHLAKHHSLLDLARPRPSLTIGCQRHRR